MLFIMIVDNLHKIFISKQYLHVYVVCDIVINNAWKVLRVYCSGLVASEIHSVSKSTLWFCIYVFRVMWLISSTSLACPLNPSIVYVADRQLLGTLKVTSHSIRCCNKRFCVIPFMEEKLRAHWTQTERCQNHVPHINNKITNEALD